MLNINHLIPEIENNRLVFWIGSGISRMAGCYSWGDIESELARADHMKERHLDELSNQPLPQRLSYCRDVYAEHNRKMQFFALLRKAVIWDDEKYKRAYMPFLKAFNLLPSIPPILTTNGDACFVKSEMFDESKIYKDVSQFIPANLLPGSIFHMHGYCDTDDALNETFCDEGYKKKYRDERFKRFLLDVAINRTVLFLGSGVSEQVYLDIFLDAKTQNGEKEPKHCALLPTHEVESKSTLVDFFKQRYNIELIGYGDVSKLTEEWTSWIRSNFVAKRELSEQAPIAEKLDNG